MLALWPALARAADPTAVAATADVPTAPAAASDGFDLSGALSLVDWLTWAATDREVDQYLADARAPDGLYARSLRPADRGLADTIEMPALYAVEAEIGGLVHEGRERMLLQIREAVVYTNPSREPLLGVALRVFGNGQDARQRGAVVQGVWVDNRPARFGLDGTVLSVELPEPLAPGDRARILLHLVEDVPEFDPTEPLEGSALAPESTGAYGRAHGTVNLGYWLPLVTPVDRRGRFDIRPIRENTEHAMFEPSLFHVVLNVPSHLSVATTGVEVHRTEEGGEATVVAVASLAREFAVELLPDAAITTAEVDGTRIRVFHPAEEPAMGRDLLRYAEGALRVYSERFGPIAAAELDIVEAPIRVLVGVEYPGLVTVDVSHQGMPYHRSLVHEWAVAHEVAHQWWSVEVGNDPALAPWIDEALASHSAGVYWSETYGAEAVADRLDYDVLDRLRSLRDAGVADTPADLPAWKYDLDQYAAVVYGRAAIFFDRVRADVGDERFFGALRTYHTLNRGRWVDAEHVVAALETAADDPHTVIALYQRWITEAHGYEDLLDASAR